MEPIERRRVALKGRREPTGGLLEQADYSIALSGNRRERLLAVGFTDSMRAALIAARDEVSRARAAQSELLAGAKGTTRGESGATEQVRRYLFKLRLLVPMALRKLRPADVSADDFVPETRLRSTANLLVHLDGIRPSVEKLEEALRPAFGGESPLAIHERLRAELGEAAGAQAARLHRLPEQTVELHLAKGRLIELIEELNRLGHVAFIHEPEIARQFGKDVMARSRRRHGGRKKAGPQEAAPQQPPGVFEEYGDE